jgi:hypothetical protein
MFEPTGVGIAGAVLEESARYAKGGKHNETNKEGRESPQRPPDINKECHKLKPVSPTLSNPTPE